MRRLTLIHGFLGAARDWRDLLPHLPQDWDCRCLEIPWQGGWQEVVDQLGSRASRNSVLVGYSMGARLALGCAVRCPERYAGLVLISGRPGLPPRQREARWGHDCQLAQRLESEPLASFLRAWYQQELFQPLSDRDVDQLVAEKRSLDPRLLSRQLRSLSVAQQPDYWPALSQLEMPVCVVAGEQDVRYVSISQRMEKRLPDGRLHIVPGVGHLVHRLQPAALAAIVLPFVESLPEENQAA